MRVALAIGARLCAGGALALFAAARPGSRFGRDKPDYVLLVQRRSDHVLNSAGRLAVIPKAFHEPLVDFSDDAQLSATLERELEEELFGRTDVDNTQGERRHADPFHLTRLSAPIRWLIEHNDSEHWRMECTGFGLNLVSGNFEFACLIVIEDEEWWSRFGGHVEANWETEGLRRYSSLDHDGLTNLVHDGSWSNEGLFAFLQGSRRLCEDRRTSSEPAVDEAGDVVADNWYTGNATDEGGTYRGWMLGHFVDAAYGVRKTEALEVKWGVHPAGQQRPEWTADEQRTTLLLMIRGRFRLDLSVGTTILEREGDYVVWGPGINHSWQAEEDSIVVTIRWPSTAS